MYHNHRFEALDFLLEDGRISQMGGCEGERCDEVIDAGGKRVVPGFIDIHTHGAVGVDVNGADADGFEKICRFFASQGTTSWLCSVLTDTKEQTMYAIRMYKEWKIRSIVVQISWESIWKGRFYARLIRVPCRNTF